MASVTGEGGLTNFLTGFGVVKPMKLLAKYIDFDVSYFFIMRYK